MIHVLAFAILLSPGAMPTSLADAAKRWNANPQGQEATDLANYLRSRFSKETNLSEGKHLPAMEGTLAAWVLEAPTAKTVSVVSADQERNQLLRLGGSDLFVSIVEIANFREVKFEYEVDGAPVGGGGFRLEYFPLGELSKPQNGVPKGTLTQMPDWNSTVYPETTRKWWVYAPPDVTAEEELAVMVFQDGETYAKGEGNACVVFDNLLHNKKIPRLIGIFINPGKPIFGDRGESTQRSDEYDTCTPRYAEFLEKEIFPEVAKSYRLASDPKRRAICGISSGGSCAFSAAWYRPDLFHRVLSHVGSFCDFRPIDKYPTFDGKNDLDPKISATCKVAHEYPFLLRKTKPSKPIRVFLQEGTQDLDNPLGNWPLANRQMEAALLFANYPHEFVMGEGFHSKAHGIAILPESLIWLWRDD